MSENWEKVKLGNLLEYLTDYHANGSYEKLKENVELLDKEDYALMIRTTNFEQNDFEKNNKYITKEAYEFLSKSKVYYGDLIMNKIANAGSIYFLPKINKPVSLAMNLFLLRINNEKAISRFVYYNLKANESYVKSFAQGSVTKTITKEAVRNLELNLPSIKEQKAIAHILETLDEKIELNRQMNQTLEAMAQALFKSWFVDFDPVIDNAIQAGNEIPEELQARAEKRRRVIAGTVIAREERPKQSPPSLKPLLHTNPSLAAQFPAAFVFNETLGKWIPEGWEVKSFGEFVKIIKGKSYKSSELEDSKTALVTLKSFERGGGYRLDGLKEYTGSYKPEQEVFAGDLIIAYTDVTQAADLIGKPAIIIENRKYEHLVISLDVAVIRPKKESLKFFFYGLAMTNEFQSHTYSHTSGTTVLHLGKDAVGSYQFSFAGFQIIEEYDRKVKSIFKRINQTIQETETLTQLRDRLLPELISGRVRVPEGINKKI